MRGFLLPKKQNTMSRKLWVEQIAATNTFGPTRVSIDGCEDVDDLLEEIKKKFQIPGPASALTLYQPDGTTEIDVGDSPADYLKGNTRINPLIVRTVEMAHNSFLSVPASKSEMASENQTSTCEYF